MELRNLPLGSSLILKPTRRLEVSAAFQKLEMISAALSEQEFQTSSGFRIRVGESVLVAHNGKKANLKLFKSLAGIGMFIDPHKSINLSLIDRLQFAWQAFNGKLFKK